MRHPADASDPYDGLLLIDKPSGPTSHDIVDQIRRRFRFRKVGHGGTLDPRATGLLILLLGRATKLSGRLISSDKTYEGTIILGRSTDSHDGDGTVVREADCSGVTRAQLDAEAGKFRGDMLQTPPMVSAVKKDGVPLYKLARRGETVEREPKLVHIYEFRVTRFDSPQMDFILRCTKGTYVRQVAHDLGEALGCGAYLDQLRRTEVGEYAIRDALPLERIEAMQRADLVNVVIPMHRVRTVLP